MYFKSKKNLITIDSEIRVFSNLSNCVLFPWWTIFSGVLHWNRKCDSVTRSSWYFPWWWFQVKMTHIICCVSSTWTGTTSLKTYHDTAIQRQTAVTAHFSSEQLLLFAFAVAGGIHVFVCARGYCRIRWVIMHCFSFNWNGLCIHYDCLSKQCTLSDKHTIIGDPSLAALYLFSNLHCGFTI